MTAARKPLRAVSPDEKPEPKKPKSMIEAVESGGSYLDILIAQRLEMMRDVKDVTGPAKAALHRQIALHSKEIAGLEAAAKEEADESAEVPDEEFDSEAI